MNENEIPTRIELPSEFYNKESNPDTAEKVDNVEKKPEYVEIPRRISLPSDTNKRQNMLQVVKDFKDHAGAHDKLQERLKNAPYARVDSLAHYIKAEHYPQESRETIERIEQRTSYNLSILLLTSELESASTNYSADIGKLLDEIEGYHIHPEDFKNAVRNLNLILYPEQSAEQST